MMEEIFIYLRVIAWATAAGLFAVNRVWLGWVACTGFTVANIILFTVGNGPLFEIFRSLPIILVCFLAFESRRK